MIRNLLCAKCGESALQRPMHPEDAANGFQQRYMRLKARKEYVCDLCNAGIAAGTLAVAQTFYRGEELPERWEEEFGTPWAADFGCASGVVASEVKKPFKIRWIHAALGEEGDGVEGVCAFRGPDGWMPLIAADEERLKLIRQAAQQLANVSGKVVKIARFQQRLDLEEIKPQ